MEGVSLLLVYFTIYFFNWRKHTQRLLKDSNLFGAASREKGCWGRQAIRCRKDQKIVARSWGPRWGRDFGTELRRVENSVGCEQWKQGLSQTRSDGPRLMGWAGVEGRPRGPRGPGGERPGPGREARRRCRCGRGAQAAQRGWKRGAVMRLGREGSWAGLEVECPGRWVKGELRRAPRFLAWATGGAISQEELREEKTLHLDPNRLHLRNRQEGKAS